MGYSEIKHSSQVYFNRFETRPPQISVPPLPGTKVILIIPCYNEPDILTTLRSLNRGEVPRCPVEVLLVINAGPHDAPEVHQQNRVSRQQTEQWIEGEKPDYLHCHILWADDLPQKHAGVGLARKIGMDEALHRFAALNYDGLIMNLDADCTVAPNYLTALEEAWHTQNIHCCTVYFEHDLAATANSVLREGIIYYELFLRYYVNGLHYAGFPYAFHTIGSCMGARASTYALSGGMNRRKAGEDFYFLHKIAPLGNIVQLRNTTVYPSARISERVPFGTGSAQKDWLEQSDRHRFLYHPEIFEELRTFLSTVPDWYQSSWNWDEIPKKQIPKAIHHFLQDQYFARVWDDLLVSTRSWPAFQKRFFAWLDGFKVLKFVHYAREHYYKSSPAEAACFTLLKKLCIFNAEEAPTTETLLQTFRTRDWQGY